MLQDKELSSPKEKRSWRNLFWLGKLVVTLLILSYIYNTFQTEQKGVADIGDVLESVFSTIHIPVFLLMLVLVPINWALESLKWQKLANKVVAINFWSAFRGTLTGLAVGVAAPAQLGDTIGRIAVLRSDRRLEAIGAAIVSNGIQFYVSLIFGAAGWFHLQQNLQFAEQSKRWLSILLIVCILLGYIIVLFRKRLTRWHPQKPVFQKLQSYLKIIGNYTGPELLISFLYGALRYLVFLTQFVLALSLFEFPVPFTELASCVSLIFLAKTLIPAINVLGDLGLREFTALLVFRQYNLPPEEIITATFLVWILNVLGPILVGVFLIWKHKWKRNKS